MKHLVLGSALAACVGIACPSNAEAQAVFNTPDGVIVLRPHLGRAPVAAPSAPVHIRAAAALDDLDDAPVAAPVQPLVAAVMVPVEAPPPPRLAAPERIAVQAAALAPMTAPGRAPEAAPVEAGSYGGGFIEMLMTGRDPGPEARQRRAAAYHPQQMAALPEAVESQQQTAIRRVVDPRFYRQIVDYDGRHAPGTVIIDTPNKYLYLVQSDGTAIRYGIGVGRPGFEWAGMKAVTMKREWPEWRPPGVMIKRRPDLPRYMAGGPDNPLGARALYLGSSLYRIHGTNEPWTIGEAVSSGCIRMMNEDVIDLYDRTRVGTKVLVI